MSPNMKFDSVSVVLAPPPASVAVAVRLCSSNDGGAAGSSTRQVVILPSAWSGPMVAAMAVPLNVTATLVVVFEQKPQTIDCLGAL